MVRLHTGDLLPFAFRPEETAMQRWTVLACAAALAAALILPGEVRAQAETHPAAEPPTRGAADGPPAGSPGAMQKPEEKPEEAYEEPAEAAVHDPDFVPSQQVPAGSAVAFPVDI